MKIALRMGAGTKFKERRACNMYIEAERYVVALSNGVRVKIEMFMLAQDPAWSKDDVTIYARILLPEKEDRLVEELRFGERVGIAGQKLHKYWGSGTTEGYRSRSACFRSAKGSKAWGKARNWVWGEIEKLDKALEKRAKAKEL